MSITIPARAVLLDMDGTLVDSSAVVERLWTAWAVDHLLDPVNVLQVVHGRQSQESMAVLLPHRSRAANLADNETMIERETTDVDGIVAVPGPASRDARRRHRFGCSRARRGLDRARPVRRHGRR